VFQIKNLFDLLVIIRVRQ